MDKDPAIFWWEVDQRLAGINRNWSWLARTAKISRAALYRWRNGERRGGMPPHDVCLAIEYVLEGAGANIVYQWVGPVDKPSVAVTHLARATKRSVTSERATLPERTKHTERVRP